MCSENNDEIDYNWNRNTARLFIDSIGDEMIRGQLLTMYGEKFHKDSYINFLEEELRKARGHMLWGKFGLVHILSG